MPHLFRNEFTLTILAIGLSLVITAEAVRGETSFALGTDCSADSSDYYVTVPRADSVRSWGRCGVLCFGQSSVWFYCYLPDTSRGVRMDVIDAKGNLVHSITDSRGGRWDGKDAPVGDYRLRVASRDDSVQIPFCKRYGKGDFYNSAPINPMRTIDAPIDREKQEAPRSSAPRGFSLSSRAS